MAESTQTHYQPAVGQPQSSCLTGTNPSVTLLKANISWELQSSANPVCDEQSFFGHFECRRFFHQTTRIPPCQEGILGALTHLMHRTLQKEAWWSISYLRQNWALLCTAD